MLLVSQPLARFSKPVLREQKTVGSVSFALSRTRAQSDGRVVGFGRGGGSSAGPSTYSPGQGRRALDVPTGSYDTEPGVGADSHTRHVQSDRASCV